MTRKYFIVTCTIVDTDDFSKTSTYIENIYDFTDYEKNLTVNELIGDTKPCEFSRFLSFNSLRQRINPHRHYKNYVISVEEPVSSMFLSTLRSEESSSNLIEIIKSKGQEVRI